MKRFRVLNRSFIIMFSLVVLGVILHVSSAFGSDLIIEKDELNNEFLTNEVSAYLNDTQTFTRVTVSSSIMQGNEVRLAVWNDKAGQATTLKWFYKFGCYSSCSFDISILEFGLSGKYYCDAYIVSVNNISFIGRDDFNVSDITGSSPVITDLDKTNYSFKARVGNLQSASGIASVRFAIWSKTSGQDDLVWTNGTIESTINKLYQSTVTEYLSKHKYLNDTYCIHVYAKGNNGVDSFIGYLNEYIELVDNKISAFLNNEQTTVSVAISSPLMQGNEVQLAIWNDKAGQSSSLKWFYKYKCYSSCEFAITIKDFGLSGKYYCDSYLVRGNDKMYVGRDNFIVDPLTGDIPTVTDKDKENLSFKANVTNIHSDSGVKGIRFAIWSKTGGQDDLVWTNGPIVPLTKTTYNSSITEFISKHKYRNDIYYIHVYATGKNGVDSFIGSLSEKIELVENKVSASLNDEQTSSTITVSSPFIQGQEVRLAVWNDAVGQKLSLKWFSKYNYFTSCNFDISIKDFGFSGQYFCDAYLINGSSSSFLGRSNFKVYEITSNKPFVSDIDKNTLSFKVNVSDINSTSKLKNCSIAVWTEKYGQDDLIWTDAHIANDNSYTYSAYSQTYVPEHHFENGIYNIHVYATGENGVKSFVGCLKADIELVVDPGYKVILNESETLAYAYIMDDVLLKKGKLQFAAWSEVTKQADIRWYNANLNGKLGYYNIPISDFKQLGKYFVDAYYIESSGKSTFLGRLDFNIVPPTLDARITNVDGHKGRFQVEIYNITKIETILDFSTPTWPNAYGPSTAVWYKPEKQSDLTFIAKPDVSYHSFAFGAYTTHVYANMLNGCSLALRSIQTSIQADNYIGVARLDVSIYRLCAKGIAGQVSNISFPTWSDGSGQQDLIWYSAHKESDNGWYVDLNAKKHWPDGLFITDCYAYNASGTGRMVGRIQYIVPKEATDISGNAQLDMIIKNIIRGYSTLGECFNYVAHSFSYRSGDVWPGGEWTIPYAIEMATVGSGNCYRFAALFLWCARGLCYSASAISGQVPATRGGLTPHGWVEVYLNGQTYVCDPDLEHELPGYNWYMTTYADAPVDYYK